MPSKRFAAKNDVVSALLLVSASILFTLGVLELGLRFAGYNPFRPIQKDERAMFLRVSSNPDRIYEAVPNAHGRGWGTDVVINQHGFRGHDYELQKPIGTFRIIVLGDSIAFGNNLQSGEEFSSVLERMYVKSGQHVEVMNLALGGYDTLQEVAALEDTGLAFKPDLVILAYCINDITVASPNADYIARLKTYRSTFYRSRLAQFIRVQLARFEMARFIKESNTERKFAQTYKDRLANIDNDPLLDQLRMKLRQDIASVHQDYPFTNEYTDDIHLRRLRYGLEKLHALQTSEGFRTIALVIPYLMENDESRRLYQDVYAIIGHELDRLSIPVINLSPVFSQAGLPSLLLNPKDGIHPNARGHVIMADELYKTINTH